jgi:hypothetical protein
MNGGASSIESVSWMTVNDDPKKIRRSPSRKSRFAAIKNAESSLMKVLRNDR